MISSEIKILIVQYFWRQIPATPRFQISHKFRWGYSRSRSLLYKSVGEQKYPGAWKFPPNNKGIERSVLTFASILITFRPGRRIKYHQKIPLSDLQLM